MGDLDSPRIQLASTHPYVSAFRVSGPGIDEQVPLEDPDWAVDDHVPGRHSVELAILTPYGAGRSQSFTYSIR